MTRLHYTIKPEAIEIMNRLGVMTVECSLALIEFHLPRMSRDDLARARKTIAALKTKRRIWK